MDMSYHYRRRALRDKGKARQHAIAYCNPNLMSVQYISMFCSYNVMNILLALITKKQFHTRLMHMYICIHVCVHAYCQYKWNATLTLLSHAEHLALLRNSPMSNCIASWPLNSMRYALIALLEFSITITILNHLSCMSAITPCKCRLFDAKSFTFYEIHAFQI